MVDCGLEVKGRKGEKMDHDELTLSGAQIVSYAVPDLIITRLMRFGHRMCSPAHRSVNIRERILNA